MDGENLTRYLLEQLDYIETKSCSQILTGVILWLEMRQQFRNRVLKYISFQGMHFFLCKPVYFGFVRPLKLSVIVIPDDLKKMNYLWNNKSPIKIKTSM